MHFVCTVFELFMALVVCVFVYVCILSVYEVFQWYSYTACGWSKIIFDSVCTHHAFC